MRKHIVAVLCLLAAMGSWAGQRFGEDITGERMPAAPWWTVVSAGILGAGWTLWIKRRPASWPQVTAGAVLGLVLLAGSLSRLPHTILYTIVSVLQLIMPGYSAFDVMPGSEVVPKMVGYVLALAAAVALAYATITVRREVRGRCLRCGRPHAEPKPVPKQRLIAFGLLSIVACLPYGLLKVSWSFGSRFGITGHQFDQVGFASPGFGDTAMLTGISIVASACMLLRLDARGLRPVLAFVGAVGSVMLLPVGLIGGAGVAAHLLGLMSIDSSEIAAWAFSIVYVSFLSWGIGLCGLTITYVRATTRPCRSHRPALDGSLRHAPAEL